MRIGRRRALQAMGAAGATLAAPHIVQAQQPLDTLKIIVGYPPGGVSDVVARLIAERLAPVHARSVIVDNKPGAAGRIGIDLLKGSPPDGRTLLLTPASTVTVYPDIYRQLSYNPTTDLAPVSLCASFVHGLAVGPMVPPEVKTLAQLGDWSKANPAKASCGNPGEGSFPRFLTLVMAKALGAPIQAVPYRGGLAALSDMMANQLAALMLPDGSFLAHTKGNRIRVLATSGEARSPFYPDVPTFAEQGVKEIVVAERQDRRHEGDRRRLRQSRHGAQGQRPGRAGGPDQVRGRDLGPDHPLHRLQAAGVGWPHADRLLLWPVHGRRRAGGAGIPILPAVPSAS